jgi:hypothetical protein
MCKKNKSLTDFADFIKQIEFDEYGNPTNLQYNTQYGAAVWVNIAYLDYVTYLNYVTDKIRITPKPKMRPMTAEEIYLEMPCRVLVNKVKYIIVDMGLSYVNVYDVAQAKVKTLDIEYFNTYATRPDGSRFEVEDV